ncbi:hypothetical protein MKW98_031705 [Papaver atlanticum]|uniref:non-specific serine/threonine protein kinase n=1 Tax=Papaver atlanticum TaxID=357466 RepID=A0AAD4X9U6_9MAGN|nr:hypothetical protein MKW98_031705 [Papaver atlanticum]
MAVSFATKIGSAAGGVLLVLIVAGLLWYWLHYRKLSNKNSETGSSDPSALVEWNRGGSVSVGGPMLYGPQGARQFKLEELDQATKKFSETNFIGVGSFGLVYTGLLHDGTFAVVKRRSGAPRQEFVEEVCYLSDIQHRNLVTLLGYCQEDGSQMLVYEYLPNDSVCSHLYDNNGQDSTTKLEFKQRLSIALGAAKGLCHLHSLKPPLVHKNFRTANVLVDENFIPKIADAGILRLLEKIEEAGPSSGTANDNAFRDPEVEESRLLSESGDVYSFGVFLLELISGQEVSKISFSAPGESLIKWVESRLGLNSLVDNRLTSNFTSEGMKDLIRLTIGCLNKIGRWRPKMDMVVRELDRILEKEMTRTTVMGTGITTVVTPGSELFTAK